MEKINIAELLKDCPQGMELDCASYDNVSFDKISDDKKATYPIFCYITDKEGNRSGISFTKNGCESRRYGAKCVIFPKGKTTWEGFHRPFKDGEIVAHDYPHRDELQIFIFKDKKGNNTLSTCYLMLDGDELDLGESMYYVTRLATEEEKQKLFDALKAKGYKWNAETKTLELLFKPRFKVGDRIEDKDGYIVKITEVNEEDEGYEYESVIAKGTGCIVFSREDEWELVPNKFDLTTLKPFKSSVLVRDDEAEKWIPAIWGFYDAGMEFPHILVGGTEFKMCIPYEGNQELMGTTKDCEEFYKTWEE